MKAVYMALAGVLTTEAHAATGIGHHHPVPFKARRITCTGALKSEMSD